MAIMLPPLADKTAGAQPLAYAAKGGDVLRWRWFATDAAGKRTAAADPRLVDAFKVLGRITADPRSKPSGLAVRRTGRSCDASLGAPAPLPDGSVVSGAPSQRLQWDVAASAYYMDARLPKRAGCYQVGTKPARGRSQRCPRNTAKIRGECAGPNHLRHWVQSTWASGSTCEPASPLPGLLFPPCRWICGGLA
jgi:hypothetical protein